MSSKSTPHVVVHDHDDPRFEPWLATMLLSLVPLFVAMFTPFLIQVALYALGAALLIGGFVAFIVRERRRAQARRPGDYVPARVVEGDPVDVGEEEP